MMRVTRVEILVQAVSRTRYPVELSTANLSTDRFAPKFMPQELTRAAKNESGLRGAPAARKLDDYVETMFCNSDGYPNGFQPIENACEVECYDGV